MARLLLLISLALLIGIVLSVPSNTDDKSTRTRKEKHSKEKSVKSYKKRGESYDKHKKHRGHDKHNSASHEVHENIGEHESHNSHEEYQSHDKTKKHDDKHKKNNKHSKSSKRYKKHSSRREQTNDAANEIFDHEDAGWEYENTNAVDTRRILFSKNTQKGRRPYMVYLQLTKESAKAHKYRGWLCGGVIVERSYVLTSAACVEDAEHFYIVSGTVKVVDSFDYKSDQCVCNNRRKVVWKCIPKNYKFDFQDSIKWSSNDIAIVKVNKPFKFGIVEKGCDFATNLIAYNNISRDLEKPGTKGWIAGWGSGSNFREGVYRRHQESVHIPKNAKCLQEAKVCIMDNELCAKKWSQRFRSIIQQYMICTKDIMKRLSEVCDKRYANCTSLDSRRTDLMEPSRLDEIDLGRHLQEPDDYTARRSGQGGFCENDHGGPLIVKYQSKERIIGVISACKIDPKTHSCHGPFLYTSVFKNRQFISCSIYKDTEAACRRVFRTGITHEEWTVDWDTVKEDDDRKDDEDNDNNNADKENDNISDKENDNNDDKKNDNNTDKENDNNADKENDSNADKENENNGKENDNNGDKENSSDDGSQETLRESKNREKDKGSKSSSSEESKEKSKHNKTKEKSAEKKNKTVEKKDSSSSEEKPKSKKEKKTLREASDSSSSSDEKRKGRRDNKEEVFYESSKDDNVNEPNSNE